MASSTGITHEFPPFIRVYNDGRVERLQTAPLLPPSTDPITGVQTKDIVIPSNPEVKSRIFLPKIDHADPTKKFPLVIHIHGGGFCIGSPLNIVTQKVLMPLVSQTPAVVISIGYRLAPEHPLPTAHHDCWAAFQWIATHALGSGPEEWINDYIDLSRVFITGESAGANLAHYVAVQAGINNSSLGIRGLIAVHPYFSKKEPDEMVKFLYPTSSGSDDDPKLNPRSDPGLEKMGCSRVLIIVAEKDHLKPRAIAYKETLEQSKWGGKVEYMENVGEDHCFHLFDQSSEKAKELYHAMISFINQ